ncbi:MAG: ATP-binding cassette domain-containing protein [Oscillospiraceae bacterium]|nr:ATP-binding cassette domain-containing protein [Oscillospiraceae bacterium]
MQNQSDRKVLLSLKDVEVKFNVRGRILTAIRRVSLDIYENEALAIVGESGSGKSVLTKTFAGMLESNGFISNGTIILSDDEISDTSVELNAANSRKLKQYQDMLNKHSVLERGAAEFRAIQEKKNEIQAAQALSLDEEADFNTRMKKLKDTIVDKNNYLQTLDRRNAEDAKEIVKVKQQIAEFEAEREQLEAERKKILEERMAKYKSESGHAARDAEALKKLEAERAEKIAKADNPDNPNGLTDEVLARNERLAKELLLSTARYPWKKQLKFRRKLDKAFKIAMSTGEDLNDPDVLGKIFDVAAFRVEYRSTETPEERDAAMQTEEGKDLKPIKNPVLHGYAIVDCAKVKYTEDWQKIRGTRIATVFQDPMTSLNPVITIGKQIMSVILKHQKCSREEARARTIEIMGKVGIPDPEKRFDDYPFEYSGGMRQRIVIAIALSCQPKILICDEPTTALDVTIQAQILQLIKDLQRDLGFTVVYITHDLGVVANVAERVAVLYAGQIVEIGSVEEIFYEPKHPYTWALLSSLPQLCEKGTDLFSIPGTPPSLYNKIKGDAFAPRNQYAMAIDLEKEPPMFQVSPTHFAKTWLLDPRAPKVEIPKNITNLHEKMKRLHVDYEF